MTALADTLPDDPEALKAIVLAERAAHAASLAERDAEAECYKDCDDPNCPYTH